MNVADVVVHSRHGNTLLTMCWIHSCHWHAIWWSCLPVDSSWSICLIISCLIHHYGSIPLLMLVSLSLEHCF